MAAAAGIANAETETDCNDSAWASLPPNVIVSIMLKLSLQDLCRCSTVCRSWQLAAEADRLWQALLSDWYSCTAPTQHANSCKESMMQLKTGTLWSCGSAWPYLTASIPGAPASSRATELVKVWSNNTTTTLPLQRFCPLPAGFAVTAVAAGRSHLVLLSSSGNVIDTRVDTAATAVAPLAAQQPLAGDGGAAAVVAPDAAQAQAHEFPGDPLAAAVEAAALPAAAAAATDELGHAPLRAVWMAHNHDEDIVEEDLEEVLHLEQQQQQPHQQQQMLGVLQMMNIWQPFGARVSSIAAGTGHVLAVASSGQVWGWGSNACGQLGLGHMQPWVASPVEITAALDGAWKADSDTIAAAACGALHSSLLATSGTVYTAGCNKQGQCGQEQGMLLCTAFCQPVQAGKKASSVKAAAVACGLSNTVVATKQGRLLVCGDAASGQCGAAHVKQRACYQFVDCGPQLGWHGLNRPTAAQVAAAGGDVAQALPKVVSVAAGCNTCYALTNEGEMFAWGAGGKGQLGSGGTPKVQATPAKLAWARRISQISASLDGQFAAAVDVNGHLYTWGAGKWGQLGHGDTSKRTVGRTVKQLRHTQVLQAVCGSESLLCLTCARPSAHQSNAHGAVSTDNSCKSAGSAAQPAASASARDSRTVTSVGQCVRSESPPVGSSCSGLGDRELTSRLATAAAAVELGDMSMDGVGWVDVEGQGPFYCPAPRSSRKGLRAARRNVSADSPQRSNELQDVVSATIDSFSSAGCSSSQQTQHQQRWLQGLHSTGNTGGDRSSAAKRTEGGMREAESDGLPRPNRRPQMDKGFRRLLKRLLKGFVADNRQRELQFPATLSSSDRYYIHVAAEAWGLGHASHNDGEQRIIKVWKISRSRRMRSGPDPDFDSD